MNKTISIVICIDNAQESELGIPLSSINNQLGVDFFGIDVILVDNGTYKLNRPEMLDIFTNLKLQYLRLNQAVSVESGRQFGVDNARGEYVLFMDNNGQLNSLNALQEYETSITSSDIELVSGLGLQEAVNPDLQQEYTVSHDIHSLAGKLVKVDLLKRNDIEFKDNLHPYAEEYVVRLLNQLALQQATIEEVSYAQFSSRYLRKEQKADKPDVPWMTMMGDYLDKLVTIDTDKFAAELARFTIRFYTLRKMVGFAQQDDVQRIMNEIITDYRGNWNQTLAYIKQVVTTDHNSDAPWNKEPEQFSNYLAQLNVLAI